MTSDKKRIEPKINARVTPAEQELLQILSNYEGITPSEYIRTAVKTKMIEQILSMYGEEGRKEEWGEAVDKLISSLKGGNNG